MKQVAVIYPYKQIGEMNTRDALVLPVESEMMAPTTGHNISKYSRFLRMYRKSKTLFVRWIESPAPLWMFIIVSAVFYIVLAAIAIDMIRLYGKIKTLRSANCSCSYLISS